MKGTQVLASIYHYTESTSTMFLSQARKHIQVSLGSATSEFRAAAETMSKGSQATN